MSEESMTRVVFARDILRGVADLALDDPTVICIAASAVAFGAHRRSPLLAVSAFYGAYAASRVVNSIANAIGHGLSAVAHTTANE